MGACVGGGTRGGWDWRRAPATYSGMVATAAIPVGYSVIDVDVAGTKGRTQEDTNRHDRSDMLTSVCRIGEK